MHLASLKRTNNKELNLLKGKEEAEGRGVEEGKDARGEGAGGRKREHVRKGAS
jgi:hypothetical protein